MIEVTDGIVIGGDALVDVLATVESAIEARASARNRPSPEAVAA